MKSNTLIETIEKNQTWLSATIATLLSVATFIFYYPSLHYGFVFDDLPTITEYFHVRVFDPIGQFFSNSRWISRLLNQWTYKHWQTDPFGYRIINLMIFIATGLMIFFILVKAFSMLKKNNFLNKYAYLLATIVSGLFLLHPTQTQTATYVTQMRLEGLMAFFVFAILLSFTYAAHASKQSVRIALYSVTTILMIFAAGTKEIVIVAPVLVLLFDWFLLAEGDWSVFKKRLIIHGILLMAMLGTLSKLGYTPTPKTISTMVTTPLRNNRGNTVTESPTERITAVPYFISQFKVLVHYMTIFINPFQLSFDYETRLATGFFKSDVIVPLLLLLMLFFACGYLLYYDISNPIVFGTAWFFAAMLPRASIFPTTELICDYKTFLPSFGILFVMGIGIVHLLVWAWGFVTWHQKKETQVATVAMLFIMLGLATASRNVVWTSELTFWKDVTTKAPARSRGYNNYAIALWESGDSDGAIANYKKALDLDGSYGEPHVNLATIYQGMGRKDEALEHYKKALDTGEVHPELYHNLGVLHMSDENWATAELCFKEAISVRPYASGSCLQLGRIYQMQNKMNEALECYALALQGDRPNLKELLYGYASVNYQLGNIDKAQEYFAKLDKNYQDVSFQLGCCYYAKNRYKESIEHFATACSLDPQNTLSRYNYAMALLNTGKYQEALQEYVKCDNEKQSLPFLPLHAAHCLYRVGEKNAAKQGLLALIKTTPFAPVKEEAQAFMKEHGLT